MRLLALHAVIVLVILLGILLLAPLRQDRKGRLRGTESGSAAAERLYRAAQG